MSIQAVAWVLDHSKAEGCHRLVLLSIANHANERQGHISYPGLNTIAREARVHKATVVRAIAELEQIGELKVEHRSAGGRTRTNQYRLIGMPEWSQDATVTDFETVASRRETVASDRENCRISSRNGCEVRPEPMNRKGTNRTGRRNAGDSSSAALMATRDAEPGGFGEAEL